MYEYEFYCALVEKFVERVLRREMYAYEIEELFSDVSGYIFAVGGGGLYHVIRLWRLRFFFAAWGVLLLFGSYFRTSMYLVIVFEI